MVGILDCSLDAICGNKYKLLLVILVTALLLWVVKGDHMAFSLILNRCYHVIYLYIIVIIIQMYTISITLEEVAIKFLTNLILLWEYHLAL